MPTLEMGRTLRFGPAGRGSARQHACVWKRGKENSTVQFIESLFQPHLRNLQEGLDLAARRQALLAGNLANVNTPGYQRRDLDFHVTLSQAGETFRLPKRAINAKSLREQHATGGLRVDGNGVDLEAEITAMAQTQFRYQALAEMTARHFAGLKLVIREGRQ
jgi:flagellar basal-body rod protein FlgB